MGCDIHLYKEKFVGGKWVTADQWVAYDYGDDDKGQEVPFKARFTDRNYNLFGLLSKGVRSEHPFSFEQRGLPFNPCEEIAAESEGWGVDGHSHSYLYLHELRDMLAHIASTSVKISGMKDKVELDALHASIEGDGDTDWNLLYPYCQGTTMNTYVKFAVDVPASFIIGDGLERIIAGFDGIDGDNHRIVFFFDN